VRTEILLGQGDVIHIPAKVPHQVKLAPGQDGDLLRR